MQKIVLIIAALYGMISIILGAFGAHKFKEFLSSDKLMSFETGVKYQMFHAMVLLILGFQFSFQSTTEKSMIWSLILGTFLFSVSIYFLSFASYWNINLKWLGPITPLGGLLMIIGWFLLILVVWRRV